MHPDVKGQQLVAVHTCSGYSSYRSPRQGRNKGAWSLGRFNHQLDEFVGWSMVGISLVSSGVINAKGVAWCAS
jgi:hypothetical protein